MVNRKRIIDLMKQKEICGKEMAQMIGMSESMMSYILRGLREPNVATLVRIAKALDVPVDELIVKEGNV